MAAHTVIVWGKEVRIPVERRSKSVWIATGDYMGKTIQVASLKPCRARAGRLQASVSTAQANLANR
jgi:hypothetical protein